MSKSSPRTITGLSSGITIRFDEETDKILPDLAVGLGFETVSDFIISLVDREIEEQKNGTNF